MPQNFTRQLDRIDKKLNQTKYNINLNDDNSFYIFPFTLIAGFINQTNIGINENINIYDFATWQRVFTGLSNLIARWKGSTKVYKKNDDDLFLTKEFKVGEYFKGFISTKVQSTIFSSSNIDSSFISQITNETITCYTYDEISAENLQDFYLIPQIKSNKWLYISDVKHHEAGGKKLYTLTFESVNNKIATTGRAIEEYIQFGAPGEGYPYPKIINQSVIIDVARAKDIYTQSYQVEVAGPCAFSAQYAYGRPVKTKDDDTGVIEPQFNPEIEAPRLLMPFVVETPVPSPINTKPSAEPNYFYGSFNPRYDDYYKTWKEPMVNNFDLSQRTQYEGVLTHPSKKIVEESNPINAIDNAFQHQMWDKNWKIKLDNVSFDTSADNMSPEKLTLNGEYTLPELLTFAIFITNPITTLPLSVNQLISWNIKDLPIIGGFLNKLTFGIPLGWKDNNIRVKAPNIPLIIPATIVKYGNVMRNQSDGDDLYIPLELFQGTLESEATSFSGINALGSILKIQLTDRFSKVINGQTYIFNTRDLGQTPPKYDDDNNEINYGENKPDKLIIDETIKPVARKVVGFVIDFACWKGITKLPYRKTFFSAGNLQVFSATYMSNAGFTGSLRDWTNNMKLSDWNTNDDKYIEYPKAITEPQVPDPSLTDIQLTSYIPKTIVYNSMIFGDVHDRVERLFEYFKMIHRSAGGASSVSDIATNWINRGFRFGTYDLNSIGGTIGLNQNYEFIVITFKIRIDRSDLTDEFTIKIKVRDLITSSFITYDLKNQNWIDPRTNVSFDFMQLWDNVSLLPKQRIIQRNFSSLKYQVSGVGDATRIFYNENHNTIFRIEIDNNLLKFGWNEDIEGYIPNQILIDGKETTDNKPANPPFHEMYIEGVFPQYNALDQYYYRYFSGKFDDIHIMEIKNIFLQKR